MESEGWVEMDRLLFSVMTLRLVAKITTTLAQIVYRVVTRGGMV